MFKISPKFKIDLVERIEEALWLQFRSYSRVLAYLREWHEEKYSNGFEWSENFSIIFKDSEHTQIDVLQTLSSMDGELVIKIALDLGLETPDFIPSIPTFRNEIKDHYKNASEVFEKAYGEVEKDPSLAIGLANSALESLLKDVCISMNLDGYKEHMTLNDLVKMVMKQFSEDNPDFPEEIRKFSNNICSATKCIEDIRSDKTSFHGKSSGCKIIDNPAYAYFIVNAVATIGLFVSNYQREETDNNSVSSIGEMPF